MSTIPDAKRWGQLLTTVFAKRASDLRLLVLCDLPSAGLPDTRSWRWLRWLAGHMARLSAMPESQLGFEEIYLLLYENVGITNADFPDAFFLHRAEKLEKDFIPQSPLGEKVKLGSLLDQQTLVIAPTRLSTSAPLRLLGKKHLCRGITMPGFTAAMLPALELDYQQVKVRVDSYKELLDAAEGVEMIFRAENQRYGIYFDLRYRLAQSSSGLQTEPGQVGNFPSGEAFIVPYEGEKPGIPSLTSGTLPVEFDGEVVLFEVQDNRLQRVISKGRQSDKQQKLLSEEPASGNMAEVGLGVMASWGLKAVNVIYADEKLGLHVGFGRSDHFGGFCGEKDFRDPARLIHDDWIYIHSLQPKISVAEVDLIFAGEKRKQLMRDDEYVI